MLSITQYLANRNGQATFRQLAKWSNESMVGVLTLLQDAINAGEIAADLPTVFTGATKVAVTFPVLEVPIVLSPVVLSSLVLSPVVLSPLIVDDPALVEAPTHCPTCGHRLPKVSRVSNGIPAARAMRPETYGEQYSTMVEALVAHPAGVISIPAVRKLILVAGIPGGRLAKAIGRDRSLGEPRSAMWKPFLIGRVRYVELACADDIANI